MYACILAHFICKLPGLGFICDAYFTACSLQCHDYLSQRKVNDGTNDGMNYYSSDERLTALVFLAPIFSTVINNKKK